MLNGLNAHIPYMHVCVLGECGVCILSSHDRLFTKVAETEDIPPGSMLKTVIRDKEVLVVNVDGSFYAIDNRCSHQKGDLSKGTLNGKILTCPVHGSQFDVTSGRNVKAPKFLFFLKLKTVDLGSFEVKVEGNDVLVFQKSTWGM